MSIFNFRPQGALKFKNFSGVDLASNSALRDITVHDNFLIVLGSARYLLRYELNGQATKLAQPYQDDAYKIVSSLGRLIIHIRNSGIWVSDDNGDNWSLKHSDTAIYSTMAANGAGIIVAGRNVGGSGLYSLDNGDTWTATTLGNGGTNANTAQGLTWHESLGKFIRVSTGPNINWSTDGINFFVIDQSGHGFNTLTGQAIFNGKIFFNDTTGRIYSSADEGATLTELTNTLFYNDVSGPSSVALQCGSLISFDNRLYSSHKGGGIQYSEDGVIFIPATVGTNNSSSEKVANFAIFNNELYGAVGADLVKTLNE